MTPPSSCEWTASYLRVSARRVAVRASERSSGTLAHDGPIRTCLTNGGRRQRRMRQTAHLDVASERVGHQIDGWPSVTSARMR